jgi:hypothetical protein
LKHGAKRPAHILVVINDQNRWLYICHLLDRRHRE